MGPFSYLYLIVDTAPDYEIHALLDHTQLKYVQLTPEGQGLCLAFDSSSIVLHMGYNQAHRSDAGVREALKELPTAECVSTCQTVFVE